MSRKSSGMMILTLILIALDWGSSGNMNLTRMQAMAASCKNLGQISQIQDGSVERKQLRGQWQKIVPNTKLCYGDLLKTTSNRGKKVTVKIKCTNSAQTERRVPADETVGVANVCLPPLPNPSRRETDGGAS